MDSGGVDQKFESALEHLTMLENVSIINFEFAIFVFLTNFPCFDENLIFALIKVLLLRGVDLPGLCRLNIWYNW